MPAANLQTIIVTKAVAKTRAKAQQLAEPHSHRLYTSRETSKSWRFRQRPPSDFKKGSFRTFPLPGHHGITLIYGDLKRTKNPKPKGGRVLAGRQRHFQTGGEGLEDINRDWDFWLEMQGKIARARSRNMIQVLALSTRRRRIQSFSIKDLIMGSIADRARELRYLRTQPTPANDERFYNELVGDNPKRRSVRMRKVSSYWDSEIPARVVVYRKDPYEIGLILQERLGVIVISVEDAGGNLVVVKEETVRFPKLRLVRPGKSLERQRTLDLLERAKEIIHDEGPSMRRAFMKASNPGKKHTKKKAAKKVAKRKTKKKVARKRSKKPSYIKLKDPRLMPDPGPSAWCGSILEFAIKPNGKKKPRWTKVDENGNWLWEGGLKKEWLFLWSPKYKAIVGVRRPRGLKGGPGKFPGKGEVIRDGGGAKMFEIFAARPAERTQMAEIEEVPLQKWGDGAHVVYRSDKWSKKRRTTDYIHGLKKGVKIYCGPTIANPEIFLCFGGKLTMTERGLVF